MAGLIVDRRSRRVNVSGDAGGSGWCCFRGCRLGGLGLRRSMADRYDDDQDRYGGDQDRYGAKRNHQAAAGHRAALLRDT